MEWKTGKIKEIKDQDTIWHVQEQLQQWYRKLSVIILEIIEPDDNDQLLNLTITTAATRNDAAKNAQCGNQYQQVTNASIGKVSENLLKYRNLIKGPNAQIWERALANDLERLTKVFD